MQVRKNVAVAGEAKQKAAAEKSSSLEDFTIRNSNKRKRSMFLDRQADQKDQNYDRDPTAKKRRLVWDEKLHKKFLDALEYLGTEAVPKKIWERMNVDGLTRDNVASHLQKHKKKLEYQNKKRQKNVSLITPQEGGMYSGEGSSKFYRGSNLHFPAHHINNIPQLFSLQQQSTNHNPMTQLISPLGHHHHGVSVTVSGKNLVMTNQHHHHHQTSELPHIKNSEESSFCNEDEFEVSNLISSFTQNPEEMSLFHLLKPVMTTLMLPNENQLSLNPQQMMNVHKPSMLHTSSFPLSLTHNTFLDQNETISMVNKSDMILARIDATIVRNTNVLNMYGTNNSTDDETNDRQLNQNDPNNQDVNVRPNQPKQNQ